MSNVVGIGDPFTSSEELTIQNLNALAVSGASQAIRKTGANTFANVATGSGGGVGAWSTPPESPDGTITVFTVGASAPTDVVADGAMIFTPDYSYASNQITFINPPVGVVKFR
jgi:hypothetical protein